MTDNKNIRHELFTDENASYQRHDNPVDQTRNTMNETKQSLEYSLGIVREAENTGKDTLVTLDRQKKQLNATNTNVDNIHIIISKSNSLLRRMARRVVTDKVLWVIIFLIIVMILLLILNSQYHWTRIN